MSQKSELSLLVLANVEALAGGEYDSNKWTEKREETNTYTDGKLTKQSVFVDCLKGGTQSNCAKSCKYKTIKDDSGNWTDWIPC